MKLQMMTTIVLLMFMLMLAEFFALAILNVDYNSQTSSLSLSTGSQGIISSLSIGAYDFAYQSLGSAIHVLTVYESNASLRGPNFITNFSYDVSSLMENGLMPNASSYAENIIMVDMNSQTLQVYNLTAFREYNGTIGKISINETPLIIYQPSPYAISVKYVENVNLNTSSGIYHYEIPVNASLSLNTTYDLYYAQQGILRPVIFSNLSQQAVPLVNTTAIAGSYYNFSYGIANDVAPLASCPSMTSSLKNMTIIVTSNAQAITNSGCENSFAGLITFANTITKAISVPYLGYSGNVNLYSLIPSGKSVLLYGPALSAFYPIPLQSMLFQNYYFTSQGTASYIQRAEDQLGDSSPQGIFAFGGINKQVALFNAGSSNVEIPDTPPTNSSVITVSGWVDYTGPQTAGSKENWLVAKSDAWSLGACGALLYVCYADYDPASGPIVDVDSQYSLSPGTWYLLTATVSNGIETVYVDGTNVLSGPSNVLNKNTGIDIGYGLGKSGPQDAYLNGSAANIQLYNETLTQTQISTLYQRGIEGLPISNSGLIGWWILNGNAQDLSGVHYNQNGTNYNTNYYLMPAGAYSSGYANFNGNAIINVSLLNVALSKAFTVTSWVNYTGPQYNGGTSFLNLILGKYNNFDFGVCTTSLDICFDDTGETGAAGHVVEGTSLSPKRWYFLSMEYSGGSTPTENVYLNGTLVISHTVPGLVAGMLGIGGYPSASGPNMNGSIANLQFYNSTLSASQLKHIFHEGITGEPISGANLITWMPLDGSVEGIGASPKVFSLSNVTFGSFSSSPLDAVSAIGQKEYPLVGSGTCISLLGCYNSTQPVVFLDSNPLIPRNTTVVDLFDANGGNVTLPYSPLLNTKNVYSISAWVDFKGTNAIPIGDMDSFLSGPVSVGYYKSTISSFVPCYYQTSGGFATCTVGSNIGQIKPNTWYMITLVVDSPADTASLYVNGTDIFSSGAGTQSISQNPYTPTNSFKIGGIALSGVFTMNGSVSNVQYYNAQLTKSQVQQLYSQGISSGPLPGPNSIGWWPLNGNAQDFTGHVLDGVPMNVSYTYTNASSSLQNIWQAMGLASYPR